MALIVKNRLINWIDGLNPGNYSDWEFISEKMLHPIQKV